ncbi:MAG: PAS domain-containing protein [Chloroflexota bacterium]
MSVETVGREPTLDEMIDAAMLDALPDAVLLVDSVDGRIVSANAAAVRMLGYERDHLERLSVIELMVADEHFRVQPVQHLARQFGEWRGQWRCRRNGGAEVLAEAIVTRVNIASHALFQWVLRDVSAGWRAREALNIIQAAVHYLDDAVAIVAPAGDGAASPSVVYVNPAYTRVTGYASDDVAGQPLPALVSRENGGTADRLLAAMRRGETVVEEGQGVRKDGTTYAAEWRVTPVEDVARTIGHFVVVERDLSGQRQAEDARVAALLETAQVEAVRVTARDVVHVVNNRLALATGALEMLRRRASIPPSTAELLGEAETALVAVSEYAERLQAVTRFALKDTPVGPSLDLDAATV